MQARETIRAGSKSFAAASRLFDRTTRERVWLLYAWCRRCDDLTDGQQGGGALGDQSRVKKRVKAIRALTERALSGQAPGDPAFDSFGIVARETGITPKMASDVIRGFELDAEGWKPQTEADLMRYCFHVAGAVGVMMAVVMGVSPRDEETLDRACDLGIAFQLANIARDVLEDDAAGRCYLPAEWLAELRIPPDKLRHKRYRKKLATLAERLAVLAKQHKRAALAGTKTLAFRKRWAIRSAAGIYGAIAVEVAKRGETAWDARVSTTKLAKARFVAGAFFRSLLPAPKLKQVPAWSRSAMGEA
ncbi:MAG: phytoene/squalene synthase family protein [Candidatus Andeanibacterium colombiense]|uniref:Phytoene/squalene synthase family protein n=1 Tax=Candidatus Andeanibacterium colombiense TaxID=3121345 RepID=A0AAJ6BR58_9SPHN|nr:MAG: phytoene/squalene synthase family protein [Sphingomonadaceae bacterium]